MPSRRRPAVLAALTGVAAAAVLALVAFLALAVASPGAPASGAIGEVSPDAVGPMVRTYYLAAEPVVWDYAPQRRNRITGRPFDAVAQVFVGRGPGRIGSTYLKSRYIAYTDATFRTRAPVDPRWRHLGMLGPVIRAQVGDTIRVVFRNRTSFPASVHPHGVLYDKSSEGAPYADGTGDRYARGDVVRPGGTYTYVWEVPERAGPGPMDGTSVAWMYHSHVDEVADTNAGLVGPLIVTKRGMARADGSPVDVDRELVGFFSVMDENASPWVGRNAARAPGGVAATTGDPGEFEESNLMHSINGFVYGNGPGFSMREGERVRWYMLSLGNEVDLHTPHWHGNTVLARGMRTDMTELLPGSMMVADMTPDAPGIWLFHCHVNDHLLAGMETRYAVLPAAG